MWRERAARLQPARQFGIGDPAFVRAGGIGCHRIRAEQDRDCVSAGGPARNLAHDGGEIGVLEDAPILFRRLAFAASSYGGNGLLGIGEEIGKPERTGLIQIEQQADALAVGVRPAFVSRNREDASRYVIS